MAECAEIASDSCSRWRLVSDLVKSCEDTVSVGIVGKYVDLADSYKSLNEALFPGGLANGVKVNLVFIDSETLEGSGYPEQLFDVDSILVPGGFGKRGIEGRTGDRLSGKRMLVPRSLRKGPET